MAVSLGNTPTTSVRRLISRWSRSSGFVDQILRQCSIGNSECEEVVAGGGEHPGDVSELGLEGGDDAVELGVDRGGVGLSENRADRRGDHLGVGPGNFGEHVAHEVHAAALPRGTDEALGDGVLEAEVVIGDHQTDAVQTASA